MDVKRLIILRGLPGAGKSTAAKLFTGAIHIESDQWFINPENGNYEFNIDDLGRAHLFCKQRTEYEMQNLCPTIVVSNTFTTESEMRPYFELAEKYGYQVTTMIVENRHGNSSVHNVPDETIEKMRNRFTVKL